MIDSLKNFWQWMKAPSFPEQPEVEERPAFLRGYKAGLKALGKMETSVLKQYIEGHLGTTWSSFDELMKTPDRAAFDECYQNAGILKAALDVLESRIGRP